MKNSLNIYLGDFRNHLDLVPKDAFWISDPPYNQDYHYTQYSDNLDDDEYGLMLAQAFKGKKAVVILYPEETMNSLAPNMVQDVSQVVSWVYPSNTAKQSRLITWWNCKPDMTKVGQAYKNPTDKRIAKRIEEGKTARLYDWWEINQVKNVSKKHTHPCPLPYEVARRIILTTTNPGDTVCDPFAGVGTVLKAALDTGRVPIGFEIDESYWKQPLASL